MKAFGYDFNITRDSSIKNLPKGIPTKGLSPPPTGPRKSKPTLESTYKTIKDGLTFVHPGYISTIIPTIRKLTWINEDLGLAVNDMVQLTNTGHRIKFDQNIKTEERDKMRRHLVERRKIWGDATNGINGLINKMIAQIWISGALSVEWVVDRSKKGIYNCALVNPETIWFSWNKSKQRFMPYQKQNFKTGGIIGEKMVRLGSNYKYFGLNGDTELPYGIPPFLTALNKVSVQQGMDKNIVFIMDQLGLLGFFETLIEKPDKKDGETDETYTTRLISLLDQAKVSIKDGIKDGTVIGFKDDHEFDFHSTTKNLSGASDIYAQNQIKLANGLKMPSDFLGFPTGGSESGMSIIFTKMLSQLANVQDLIRANLEYGYMLELTLAGFSNVTLTIEFEPSTITDELKYQQGQEYKIRNIENKYLMGVIGQQQKAEELGYDKPDQKESRAPLDASGKEKTEREQDKDKSDRKGRDKSKTQPKRKDADTKPR